MTLASRTLVIALAAVLSHAPAAHAQSAAAEALFREGRNLIKQGNLKAGCDKLEASEKIESSVGTLLNLGDCREKLGKPASAWAAFRKAEAVAKRDGNDLKRQQEARRRALKLEPDLASITVQVGAKTRTDGLVIKQDGQPVDNALWGTAIVVDPGSHTVIAEAPGRRPWKMDISVGKGGKRWVVVPTLEQEAPVAITPPPAPPPRVVTNVQAEPATTVTVEPTPRPVVATSTWTSTRKFGAGLGVAGLAAVGAGAYFGMRAKDLQEQSDAICPTAVCDDPQGLALNDRAKDNALRANVFFIAGGAAVATATIMWFVGAPDETVIAPSVGETHVGASVTGRF